MNCDWKIEAWVRLYAGFIGAGHTDPSVCASLTDKAYAQLCQRLDIIEQAHAVTLNVKQETTDAQGAAAYAQAEAQLQWINQCVKGQDVSEFAKSFPLVRAIADLFDPVSLDADTQTPAAPASNADVKQQARSPQPGEFTGEGSVKPATDAEEVELN